LSLLALLLSSTLLCNAAHAQGAPLPTTPPADAQPSTSGFDLSSISALFAQTQDTFTALQTDLLDVCADNEPFVNPIVLTQRDALENTTVENIITIAQGRCIRINLGKTWVEATYSNGDYLFKNPWSLQQDNENLKAVPGGWDEDGARLTLPPKKEQGKLCQKFGIRYLFHAHFLGLTTLTFTCQDQLHGHPKTLTFCLNIVAADDTADSTVSDDNANNNGGDDENDND
jgi:hypothetical protein